MENVDNYKKTEYWQLYPSMQTSYTYTIEPVMGIYINTDFLSVIINGESLFSEATW